MRSQQPLEIILRVLPPPEKRDWSKKENLLAPPPINFTKEKVNLDGKVFLTTWNGHVLNLMKYPGGNGNGFEPPLNGNGDPGYPKGGSHLTWLIIFVLSIWIWYRIIRLVFF